MDIKKYYDLYASVWQFFKRWYGRLSSDKDFLDMIKEAVQEVEAYGATGAKLYNATLELIEQEYLKVVK